jgi:hypothetical protein
MFVPGVDQDGVRRIEIAIGLRPGDGGADMRRDFIRRRGRGIEERFLLR